MALIVKPDLSGETPSGISTPSNFGHVEVKEGKPEIDTSTPAKADGYKESKRAQRSEKAREFRGIAKLFQKDKEVTGKTRVNRVSEPEPDTRAADPLKLMTAVFKMAADLEKGVEIVEEPEVLAHEQSDQSVAIVLDQAIAADEASVRSAIEMIEAGKKTIG